MPDSRAPFSVSTLTAGLCLAALIGGCATAPPPPQQPPPAAATVTTPPAAPTPGATHLATFTTRLAGSNMVPPVATPAMGSADAVLDTQTRLLRWKVTFSGLSGPVTMAHFHGPAAVGANAGVALGFAAPLGSPYEGRATLTVQQAGDLMAGRWYVNVHTAKFPGGEIRGQMIERK
jgi:hypothetical protein